MYLGLIMPEARAFNQCKSRMECLLYLEGYDKSISLNVEQWAMWFRSKVSDCEGNPSIYSPMSGKMIQQMDWVSGRIQITGKYQIICGLSAWVEDEWRCFFHTFKIIKIQLGAYIAT